MLVVVLQLVNLRRLLLECVEESIKPSAVGDLQPQRAVDFPPRLVLLGRERRDGLVDRNADRVEVAPELGDAPRTEIRLRVADRGVCLARTRTRGRGLATRDILISRLTTRLATVR
jgi:hypothetical protein